MTAGQVLLSRKLANDEHAIRALVAEVDELAEQVSWTVDLTTVLCQFVDGARRC